MKQTTAATRRKRDNEQIFLTKLRTNKYISAHLSNGQLLFFFSFHSEPINTEKIIIQKVNIIAQDWNVDRKYQDKTKTATDSTLKANKCTAPCIRKANFQAQHFWITRHTEYHTSYSTPHIETTNAQMNWSWREKTELNTNWNWLSWKSKYVCLTPIKYAFVIPTTNTSMPSSAPILRVSESIALNSMLFYSNCQNTRCHIMYVAHRLQCISINVQC